MLEKRSVDQMLIKARSHVHNGEVEKAQRLYQDVLQAKKELIKQELAVLKKPKQNNAIQNPPKEVISQLVNMYNQGQLSTVVEQAQILTDQYPQAFILWNLLGASASQMGMLNQAVNAYKKVLSLEPNYADAYYNMGLALQNQGKIDDAISSYNKTIALKPDYVAAYSNMGNALKLQGNLEEAIEAYKKAILLKPHYVLAYSNMGNTLQLQGKLDGAIEAYKKAISLKPDCADAYGNMGNTLKLQGKLDAAIEAYNKVISLKPNCAVAHNNKGVALQDKNKVDEAIEFHKKAISLNPDYAEAYYSIGNAYKDNGKFNHAITAYKKAISFKPHYVDPHYNLSFIYNLMGDLQKGLALYEWRLKMLDKKLSTPSKNIIWDGIKSLKNKKIVVYEEQGLGDIIQFCRYLPLLKQKGAKVTFKVKQTMHGLLKPMKKDVILVDSFPKNKKFDFEAPLMSLPFLFNTNLKTIPSVTPYLFADHKKVTSWAKHLTKKTFKVGVCWQGSKNKIDFGRSFPLSLFKSISELPSVELISIHKGEGEKQINDIDFKIFTLGHNFDAGKDAFIDTAAVMVNCDLIITSDTATAHLAGALGCPTWVILKKIPDWRWMLDRNDSPWYRNIILYRQKQQGNWKDVFDKMQKDLRLILKQKKSKK